MQFRLQLANHKKKDSSVADCFQMMKRLADTMASIGYPLHDEETMSYILAGLDSDYDSLVTSVTTRPEPISLDDLYAHLISYESRQDLNNSEVQIGSSINNAARMNSNSNNNNIGCVGRAPWRGRGRDQGAPSG